MTIGILFDLDGTLLDTAPDFQLCLNRLLEEEKREPLPIERIRPSISQGVRGLLELGFGIKVDDPNFLSLKARLLDFYEAILGNHTKAFPGIENLIEVLTLNKMPWGIVTNKPKRFTVPLLQKGLLAPSYQCVISGDTLAVSKPHPAPLQHALELLGREAHNTFYIGDAETDVLASHAAGMPSIVANYGYIPENENTLDWKAHHLVNHADEIYPLLKARM